MRRRRYRRLAAHLPARVTIERRVSAGELRGRLDVAATLRLRFAGRPAEIAARAPRPRRDRPEDVLARLSPARLVDVIRELARAGVIGSAGWGAALAPCASASRTRSTPARSARAGRALRRHRPRRRARPRRTPPTPLAASLCQALRAGLDDPDPGLVARVVAEGALAPLGRSHRFEIAVLLRLVQSLVAHRSTSRSTAPSSRRAGARWPRSRAPRGAQVLFHYDQAFLDPGPYDAGLRRYFGQRGRLHPDITVVIETDRGARAVLVEAKLYRRSRLPRPELP